MKRLSILVALAAPVLAACGSGDTTVVQTTTTTGAPASTSPAANAKSKSEYIAQADQVCSTYRGKLDSINRELSRVSSGQGRAGSLQKAAALYSQGAQTTSEEFAALRKLTPAPGDEATIQGYFDAAQQSIDLLTQVADAVHSRDTSKLGTLGPQLDSAAAKARGIAQGYGLKVCGSDLSR